MEMKIYLTEFSRLFIFMVLLFSAIGKGRTFGQFKENLSQSFKVPAQWTTALTTLIIMLEGLLAMVIFMNNQFTPLAMLCALILFTGFTILISITVIQDRLVRCNCFGQDDEYISYLDIIRNVVLILACGFYVIAHETILLETPIQLILLGMAFIAFLVITNLKNIHTISRDPN
ncbi:MAG: MauE/DoxX family redox-associated membrane protein [Cytophagales bacterium]|nr:MauE/DoxX family redox-associated membrane protein [Cytophagales bacterium]